MGTKAKKGDFRETERERERKTESEGGGGVVRIQKKKLANNSEKNPERI